MTRFVLFLLTAMMFSLPSSPVPLTGAQGLPVHSDGSIFLPRDIVREELFPAFRILTDARGRSYRVDSRGVAVPQDAFRSLYLANREERIETPRVADIQTLRSGRQVRVLHRNGPVTANFVAALKRNGLAVLDYIPENGYVVFGGSEALSRTAAALAGDLDLLRDWELSDRLSQHLDLAADSLDVAVFVVNHDADRETTEFLKAHASRVFSPPVDMGPYTVHRVSLPRDGFQALASMSDVYWIEPYRLPEKADERQNQIMAGNHNGTSPTGTGYMAWLDGFALTELPNIVVDVTDTGCDRGTAESVAHPDLAGRIIAINDYTNSGSGNDYDGHGTINAGIVAGFPPDFSEAGALDPDSYLYGLGVAPGARMVCTKVMNQLQWAASASSTVMMTAAVAAGAQITSNSWGMIVVASAYDATAQEYDAIVRDVDRDPSNGLTPLVTIFAAGNEGKGDLPFGGGEAAKSLRSPGTAKNLITVGASENYRMSGQTDGCQVGDAGANNAKDLIDFSSRGPTADGRFKPDLVAPGTHITGAASTDPDYTGQGVCNGHYPASQTRYAWSSGTSHATPAAAGAAALLMAWYKQRYGALPSPAMVKAVMTTHTADMAGGDNGFGKALANIPNNAQGWGRVDLSRLFQNTSRYVLDQTQLFTATGQNFVVPPLKPADPTRPVRIALAWTDAPGATTGNSYKNNLDLAVTLNGSTNFRGNYLQNGVSQPIETFDRKNNLEQVILPASGDFQRIDVEIIAGNLVADGVPGNETDIDQDFALYIDNAMDLADCRDDSECNDGFDCTADRCDENHECVHTPDHASCDDGNPCTDDECSLESGCRNPDDDTNTCDDQDACTENDRCLSGHCLGDGLDCDDTISCTQDRCDAELQQCVHEARPERCDDGLDYTLDACDMTKGCVNTEGGNCDSPAQLPLPPGELKGTLKGRSSHLDLACEGSGGFSGPDAVFIPAEELSGEVVIGLRPDGFSGSLLAFDACSAPASCLGLAQAEDGETGELRLTLNGEPIFFVVEGPAGAQGFTLTVNRPQAPDGDADGDTGDGDASDGDITDGDNASDGDTVPDGDSVSDGDKTVDGDKVSQPELVSESCASAGNGHMGWLSLLLAFAWLGARKPRLRSPMR